MQVVGLGTTPVPQIGDSTSGNYNMHTADEKVNFAFWDPYCQM